MTILILLLVVVDIIVPLLMLGARKSKFVNEYIQSDELIIAKATNSVFIIAFMVAVMAIINLIAILHIVNLNTSPAYGSSVFGETIIYILLLILLWGMLKNYCREFVVTTKRVVLKKGIVSRAVKEFRYDKLESCDVKQSIIGRAFGYGSIVIHGSGGSKVEESFIQDPYEFRQYLIDKIV